MLNDKPFFGFKNVLGFSLVVIALGLLMAVAAFGDVDSRLDLVGSFTKILGFENNMVANDRPASGNSEDIRAARPLVMAPPTLGNYSNASISLSANTTVASDAAPTNATRINVSTNASFKGSLEGDPATGTVRLTNAHPDGTYTVTVRAFDSGGLSTTKTFTLTVMTPSTCGVSWATPAPAFSVDSETQAVAVGDFNRDGKQDLASIGIKSNDVSILLGDGAGSFSGPTNFEAGQFPTSIAVADLNNDGKQDLAVGVADTVSILLGNGSGGFGSPATISVSTNSVTIGDFNGDGKKDLVVT